MLHPLIKLHCKSLLQRACPTQTALAHSNSRAAAAAVTAACKGSTLVSSIARTLHQGDAPERMALDLDVYACNEVLLLREEAGRIGLPSAVHDALLSAVLGEFQGSVVYMQT